MAAIFQDGRPMVSWNVIFCLKMVVNGQKNYRDNRVYVLSMKNVQIMLCILLKCSDYFNMAANFQDGRHRLSRNTSFALDGSRQSKDDLRNKWYIWACGQFSWWYKYYISNQISSIWPPISKMAAMGYPKIYFENNSRQSYKMIW